MIVHLHAFLGIALSVLVLFVVFDEKELYQKITLEIQARINKSLKRLKEIDRYDERMGALKACLNDCVENNAEDNKSETAALDKQIKKCEKRFSRFESLTPPKEQSSISVQAALYTALFIVSVIGLDTLFRLYESLDVHDFLHITLSTLTYFSVIYWACAWAFRAVYNQYIVHNSTPNEAAPQKGIPWRKILNYYRERMKVHTTPSSLTILLIIIALWAGLICLCRKSDPGWFLAIATIFVLFAGGMGFLARENPRNGVPYLNMYGQIAMILLFALMLGIAGSWIFHTRYIPDIFYREKRLELRIFYFVILNGFVLPILLPLGYYHFIVFVRRRGLLGSINKAENMARTLLEAPQPSPRT